MKVGVGDFLAITVWIIAIVLYGDLLILKFYIPTPDTVIGQRFGSIEKRLTDLEKK